MDSSAEVPKMHQNSWRPGLRPDPTVEAHSSTENPLDGGGGVVISPFSTWEPWLSPSGFEFRPSFRPRNVDFVPTPPHALGLFLQCI